MNKEIPSLANLTSEVNVPAIPPPNISVDSLTNLLGFLEKKKIEATFPAISVFPDMLGSILTFVNERKRMRLDEKQFQMKVSLAHEVVDKQLTVAIQNLNEQTKIQISTIQGDVQTKLTQIDRYYDAEILRIERDYDLKRDEMREYYDMLERYRRDQNRRFATMLREIKHQRGEIRKATKEIALVSNHLQQKIINGTASLEDRQYYLLLMKLRLESIGSMGEAICTLASKVK